MSRLEMSEPGESRPPRAAVIAVGTELVADGRPDTNGATIVSLLASIGIETALRVAAPDDEQAIADVVGEAARRFDLVVVTGGLGPTVDDVTREGVALALALPLERDARIHESLKRIYERRGLRLSEWSLRQAMVPRGAEVLTNEAGTAPGLLLSATGMGRVALLPGVPHEMEIMMERQLLPRLRVWMPSNAATALAVGALKVTGLNEVETQERIRDLFTGTGIGLTLLSAPGEVSVVVRGRDHAAVRRTLDEARARLGDRVFAEDVVTGLESVVGRALLERGLTLATAESCTGGLVGALLTRVPGASRWYLQGWVTYSDAAKIAQLGVEAALIARHGAVSGEVAEAMARGALRRSGAKVAVSITGIAGPDGGTADKPVGTVHIGLALEGHCRTTHHRFGGDREAVRLFAARAAMDRIRSEISR